MNWQVDDDTGAAPGWVPLGLPTALRQGAVWAVWCRRATWLRAWPPRCFQAGWAQHAAAACRRAFPSPLRPQPARICMSPPPAANPPAGMPTKLVGFDLREPTGHQGGKPRAIAELRRMFPYETVSPCRRRPAPVAPTLTERRACAACFLPSLSTCVGWSRAVACATTLPGSPQRSAVAPPLDPQPNPALPALALCSLTPWAGGDGG